MTETRKWVKLNRREVISIVSVGDLIAGRMGQYASGSAPDMLEQARSLFRLHADADPGYMEKRIRYKTGGDHGVADLQD